MKRKKLLALSMAVLYSFSVLTVSAADVQKEGTVEATQTEKMTFESTEDKQKSEVEEEVEEKQKAEEAEVEEKQKQKVEAKVDEVPEVGAETTNVSEASVNMEQKVPIVKAPTQKKLEVKAVGNNNTLVQTNPSIDGSNCAVWRSTGNGTQQKPYYLDMTGDPNGWVSADNGVFKVQAVEPGAKIDGQSRLKTFPLDFGDNTITFYVLASDGQTVEYYKVDGIRRNKRDWNARPEGLSGVSPTSDDGTDGKIIGLDSSKPYEYRVAGGPYEWTPVLEGSSEIAGLKAGIYEVHFGENKEYKAAAQGWETRVEIIAPIECPIELDRIPEEVSSILEYPKTAVSGKELIFTFSKPVRVQSVGYIQKKPDDMFGKTDKFKILSQYIDDNKTVVILEVPTLKKGQTLYINSVKLEDPSTPETKWYSINTSKEGDAQYLKYHQEVVSGQRKVADGEYVYSEGSEAKISYDNYQGLSVLYEVKSFEVFDENGEVVAKSENGEPLVVQMNGNYTVVPSVKVTKEYADLDGLKEALDLAPTEDELWRYTNETASEILYCLEWAENFFDREILKHDQDLADACEARLRKAIAALEFRPGDYSKVDEVLSSVPKDLNLYTEESKKNLLRMIDAVERGLNMSRQEDIDQFAVNIKSAIEALKFKAGDYTKVDEALAKIPKDLNSYTKESVDVLKKAQAAVIRNLDITHQKEIDKFAEDLEAAIKNLKKKTAVSSEEDNKQTKKDDKKTGVKTGDQANITSSLTLLSLSSLLILLSVWRRRKGFDS